MLHTKYTLKYTDTEKLKIRKSKYSRENANKRKSIVAILMPNKLESDYEITDSDKNK